MSIQYRSNQGDRLDEICSHYYGIAFGTVEQVLDTNPGLAKLGVELPIGTLVTLPDIEIKNANEKVKLWD